MRPEARLRGALSIFFVASTLGLGCGGSKSEPPPRTPAQRLNAEGVRRLDRGDVPGAEQMFRDALAEAELVDDLPAQAEAWNNLGALAAARHDAREAWAAHANAVRLYASSGKRVAGEVRARTNLGSAMLGLGRRDDAKAEFERAVALANELGDSTLALYARVGLAAAALQEKDAKRAGELARGAREAAERANDEGAVTAALSVEASAAELGGDDASARKLFEAALDRDRKREQPAAVAADLRALARLEARLGRRPESARYLVRLAKLERRLDALDRAEQALTEAVALFPPGDEKTLAEAELAELRRAREKDRAK